MASSEAGHARLLADIGGTNVRFALLADTGRTPVGEVSLLCAEFSGLEEAARHYLRLVGNPPVKDAAVDVATAITGDLIKLTNSPWTFSIEQTRTRLGLEQLLVLNDFTALALSLPELSAAEIRQVGGGQVQAGGPIGLIGPGTGLGVSGLVQCAGRYVPLQGEGGHTAFSPGDAREDAVLTVLRQRFGHVSNERLVSGPGLVNLYETLCRLEGVAAPVLEPHQIAEAGISSADPLCVEALTMFCAVLGTAAGNLAVTLGAAGGVYIGGGIIPKLGAWFERSPFRARFEHKGRFSTYVARMPTFVIVAEHPALRGLAVALRGAHA